MRRGCSAGVGNLWAAAGEDMERQVAPSGSKGPPGRFLDRDGFMLEDMGKKAASKK